MKKSTILLVASFYIIMMSCQNNDHTPEEHNHKQESVEHDHEGHAHEEHDHGHEEVESKASHDHENEHDNEHEGHAHEGHHHDYTTAKVELQSFNQIIKASGEIQSSVNSEKVLVATNSGIVHLVDQKIIEGMVLKAGQTVFYISGEEMVDDNISVKYDQKKAAYEKSKYDYERAEQLVKQNIISDREFQKIKLEYLNVKSEFELISKSYKKGRGNIISPSKAFIKTVFVEEGQYVEAGEKLACVIKQDKLVLRAEVSQKYLNKLSDIKAATFLLPNNSKIYNTEELNGNLLTYGKSLNAGNFYIPVNFEIDYNNELFPGSFVQVFLKGKKENNLIVIPKTSLIEDQEHYFVYVEESHDKFLKRQVKLGSQDGENIVILNGLKVGETIVTQGAYFVKLASMTSELPAHNHAH